MAVDFAKRARELVGTPFRPQGRSAETGLDCVGLVMEVFGVAEDTFRRDYRLKGDHRAEVEAELARYFGRARGGPRPGDVLLMQPAADQLHLGICTDSGFVHAHVRIGRVVETPGEPSWPVLGTFRKKRDRKARND